MIRYKSGLKKHTKKKLPNPAPVKSERTFMEQVFFSDQAGLPLSTQRFIGQGNTAPIIHELEEAFLQVAYVLDAPVVVSQLTAAIKQPTSSFENIALDLISVSCPDGKVEITGDSILLHVVISGQQIVEKNHAYTQTWSFSPVLLQPGDLMAVRVEPKKGNTASFYASATIS